MIAIIFIATLFLGPSQIPKLARAAGAAIHEFNNAKAGLAEPLPQEKKDAT